jgi:hypothetical protein
MIKLSDAANRPGRWVRSPFTAHWVLKAREILTLLEDKPYRQAQAAE